MEAHLPEELLREILAYNMLPTHSDFLRFHNDYAERYRLPPISRYSHLLLVSKRWLRVGTPLLYECLHLATDEQTAAVAKVLSANTQLGLAVRCLKLEGGLQGSFVDVAKLAPRVHSILFVFRMKPTDNIPVLREALPLLNPAFLQLETVNYHNKTISEARKLVYACIKNSWKSLRTVAVSDSYQDMWSLAGVLAESSIEEFRCRAADLRGWSRDGTLQTVLHCPGLRRIICAGGLRVEASRKILENGGISNADIDKVGFVPHSWDDGEMGNWLLVMLDMREGLPSSAQAQAPRWDSKLCVI
ncbi:hypothetical protein PsYK624_139240 [Phanerochaete sordida]|uniref:Uncharacterized protein n=1 Tax=Phanerochaete sordida TaxID=48140 RepID=A0A9P3GMK1_9APHY|nr:hypothetical protein PsYK624_139240 [Phanerochaete sordida]